MIFLIVPKYSYCRANISKSNGDIVIIVTNTLPKSPYDEALTDNLELIALAWIPFTAIGP
jgi:hypothetical protein